MNIWLIQTGEPLPLNDKVKKMRTAFLADKLIERGHSVVWWASAFDHPTRRWLVKQDYEFTIKDGFKIYALKGLGYKKSVSLFRFIGNRIIARKFKRLAPKISKPDVIVASIPAHDLAYEAVMFAKNNNIPVLVDIRDEWPDIFLTVVPGSLRKFIKSLFSRDFYMIEKALRLSDGILAMMDSLLSWGLDYAKRKQNWKDKIFYLGAKKSFKVNDESEKLQKMLEVLKGKFVVTFIGTFVQNNNPSILVDCAKNLSHSNIYFVLAGDGELFNKIKIRASGLRNIIFPGWLDSDEIVGLLKHSHAGVCPTLLDRKAFPNKVFSYLSAGLPILSAFCGDLKDFIEKQHIGFYYPPKDSHVLAERISFLNNNPALYKEMSSNAQRVFDQMFDADKVYGEYALHIEKVWAQTRSS